MAEEKKCILIGDEMTSHVTVDLDEYNYLRERASFCDLLEHALYQSATLSYDKKRLRFDSDVELLLRIGNESRYEKKLNELIFIEEETDGTDNN